MHPDNTEPVKPQTSGAEPAPTASRSRTPLIVGLLTVAALLSATGVFLGLRGINAGPVEGSGSTEDSGPVQDTGTAACGDLQRVYSAVDHVLSRAEWHEWANAARERFVGSRYADIRDAGAQFVNAQANAYNVFSTVAATDYIPPVLVTNLSTGYTNLSRACATHKVILPRMPPYPWLALPRGS